MKVSHINELRSTFAGRGHQATLSEAPEFPRFPKFDVRGVSVVRICKTLILLAAL